MLKQAVKFEIVKGERVYEMHFPADAPLGELHDVLYQMRSFVLEKITEATKQDKPIENE